MGRLLFGPVEVTDVITVGFEALFALKFLLCLNKKEKQKYTTYNLQANH